jgi:hypothetical protein
MKTAVKDRQIGYSPVTGILRITEDGVRTLYQLERFDTDFGGDGFALIKLDDDGEPVVEYHVNLHIRPDGKPGVHASCTCPDAEYRPSRPCKHWLGLLALRNDGRI